LGERSNAGLAPRLSTKRIITQDDALGKGKKQTVTVKFGEKPGGVIWQVLPDSALKIR